jgi:hypothetical protein
MRAQDPDRSAALEMSKMLLEVLSSRDQKRQQVRDLVQALHQSLVVDAEPQVTVGALSPSASRARGGGGTTQPLCQVAGSRGRGLAGRAACSVALTTETAVIFRQPSGTHRLSPQNLCMLGRGDASVSADVVKHPQPQTFWAGVRTFAFPHVLRLA